MTIGSIGSSASSSIHQTDVTAMRQKTAASMLEDMDSDKTGSVSKEEFVAFGEQLKAHAPKGAGANGTSAPTLPSADKLFASADKNGDQSLSVDELSSMMAQAETQRASAGGAARGIGAAGKQQPPGGPGGPPPGGGKGGVSETKSSDNSSSSSSKTSDPADTNHDGTVSAAEKLIYSLTHPTASSGTSSA